VFSISSYKPPGPVAAAFINDKAHDACFIMGPVGSGKTNALIFKLLRTVATLVPPLKSGVIQAKAALVRADYRTLYATTLPTWWGWFPRDFPGSEWVGGADRPATHAVNFVTPRGRRIQLFMEFKALGDKRIEDVMRGWEGTIGLMNEADLLDQDALEFMLQRTRRFPRRADIAHDAPLPPFVFGDLNPPGDPENWIAKRFIDDCPKEYKLHIQPGGLSPEAENIENLQPGYYDKLAATMDPWKVQRFVHGKIGYDRSGMPVYPEFEMRLNVAPSPLKAIAGAPITLGLDAALHPAAVIVQRAPNLQLRVLEEFYFDRVGPTRFGEMLAAALEERYRECPVGHVFYDPSADYGADKEGGEQSWIDIVRKALGVPCLPAPSNEVPLRVEAVRNMIVLPIGAETRGLVVDPRRCPMLVRGFMSFYRYKLNPDGNVQNAGAPRPEKNAYANVHDALQYACLGLVGRAGAIASAAKGLRPGEVGRAGALNTVMRSEFTL
jgi:hypothetical protein